MHINVAKRRNRPRGEPRGKRINMEFSPDVYEKVREMAEKEGLSMTRLINDILREWKNPEV